MNDEFKFIHAADFHLDEPMSGLPELPTHLKGALVEAPYVAAKRIFDLAVTEKVDFVLLAGDVFDMDGGGCRPAAFLLSQFERLADKNIVVYWCGGKIDHPDRWPANIELPKNVRTFSTSIVEEVYHSRREHPIATIVGSGYDSQRRTSADFAVDSTEVFPIGLGYGEFETNSVTSKNIRYWALGGNHQHQQIERGNGLVVSAGTPQSREPSENGTHGCVLVRVDAAGAIRSHFVETDTFRWLPQTIAIAENSSLDEIKNVIGERALKLVSDHPDRMLLVNWQIETHGSFNPQLRTEANRDEIMKWLRREFGTGQTGLWSVALGIDPPSNLPEGWYEEDTILGDFLRAIGRFQSDPSINLALHDYLPKNIDTDIASPVVRLSGEQRDQILAEVALTGVEYLAAQRDWNDAAASSQA
jgi:DNA repair protein SbcD/Mre11